MNHWTAGPAGIYLWTNVSNIAAFCPYDLSNIHGNNLCSLCLLRDISFTTKLTNRYAKLLSRQMLELIGRKRVLWASVPLRRSTAKLWALPWKKWSQPADGGSPKMQQNGAP